jgi:hypothetical protein
MTKRNEVDLEAYTAWLQTEEAREAFAEANQRADEDAEVFRRMNDIEPEVLNTPIMPIHR